MENNFFDTEVITTYIQGSMPDATKTLFEAAIKNDEKLAEEVEMVRDMLKGIELFERNRLKAIVKQAHNQLEEEDFFSIDEDMLKGIELYDKNRLKNIVGNVHDALKTEGFFEEELVREAAAVTKVIEMPTPKPKSLFNTFRLAIAASFLLLIGALTYLLIDKSPSSEQLYSANFHPDTKMLDEKIRELSLMGFGTTNADEKQSFLTALEAYKSKKYPETIGLLEKHIAQFPTNATDANTFLSLAFMENKQYEKAEMLLKTLDNPEAKWYLALCYLKANKKSEAINTLKTIVITNNIHQNKAITLLKQLEK